MRLTATPRWSNRLLLATLATLLATSLIQMLALQISGAVHGNDFKHLWIGAWLLRRGLNVYDPQWMFLIARNENLGAVNPFVYLPTTGQALIPLGMLPFPLAEALWFWANWALAWACVFCAPAWLAVARPRWAMLAGATLLAAGFPFFRQMTAGQMNVLTLALLLLAGGALLRRRDGLAGLAIGLAAAWKIAPILLLPALLVLRRPRAAASGAVVFAVCLAASWLAVGMPIMRQGLALLGQMGYGSSTWTQFGMDFYRDPFNQSLNSLLHHLLTTNPYTLPWLRLAAKSADDLTLTLTLALGLAWLAAVLHARPRLAEAEATVQRLYWAAVLLMLLAPSLLWDHYVVQTLPALMWLAGRRRALTHPARLLTFSALLAALCIPWIHQLPAWRRGAGILLMSLRLWPLLALYAWLLLAHDDDEAATPAAAEPGVADPGDTPQGAATPPGAAAGGIALLWTMPHPQSPYAHNKGSKPRKSIEKPVLPAKLWTVSIYSPAM